MADSSSDRNPIDLLAEEFAERHRRGERPSLTEYVEKHPELAEEIRDLFPALVMMENLKPATADVTGGYEPVAAAGGKKLEQLGDYRILCEVGRGGMGIVYEAEQVSLGRHVALKVLPAHALLDPQHLRRFHREARAAARLHHTNIVPVYGVGEADGLHYYVMQFIHGHGLNEVISELRRLHHQGPAIAAQPNPASESALRLLTGQFAGGPTDHAPGRPAPEVSGSSVVSPSGIHLPGESDTSSLTGSSRQYWNSVARIGIQVADALAYAGSQGILHRDVKPSNLLLDTQGIVWITDFGLAKADTDHDNLTHTGDIVGTLRFMAPERFNGQSDVRSDLYALGLTLYELLTLRPAFDETNRSKLIEQVMHGEPARPRKINAAVPRDLETIVLKCISRQPHKRYQAPAELAEDLRRFVDDKPILARRVSETEKFWLWCKRNPAMACLLAALVLVFLLGFAGVAWKWQEAEVQRQAAEKARDDAATEAQNANQARDQAAKEEARARDEGQRAEHALYCNQIARARLEYQLNNAPGADTLLQQCATKRRGWEWDVLNGLCHAELFVLGGHSGWVNAVAYSPDGKLIASAGGGNPYWTNPGARLVHGEAILWDNVTGKPRARLEGHKHVVTGMAFSPDGNLLATTSEDATARIWDVATGKDRVLPAPAGLTCVCFRPDGRRIAAGCRDGAVHFWDVATGQPYPPLAPGKVAVGRVTYSPDGRWLATTAWDDRSGDVRLWSAADLTPVAALEGGKATYYDLAFSPDSRTLAGAGTGITLWDMPAGKLQRILTGHTGAVHSVAFDSDGRSLVSSGADSTVRVWDLGSGLEEQVFRGHTSIVGAAAFSPAGDRIVSGGQDDSVRVWDRTAYRERPRVIFQGWLNDREVEEWGANLEAISYAAGGREMVVVQRSGDYSRLDSRTYTLRDRGHCDLFSAWLAPGDLACLDGDGRYLVGIAANQRAVKCWDLRSGKERATLGAHEVPVRYTTISADGRRVAASGPGETRRSLRQRNEVRVWDVAEGRVLLEVRDDTWSAYRVALSPSGDRLAVVGVRVVAGMDGPTPGRQVFVKVYDVATRQELQEHGGLEQVFGGGIAFSPDGQRLAAIDLPGNVYVWDLTGKRPAMVSHEGPSLAMDVAFSPDGQRLVVASRQLTKLLDATTGQELLTLRAAVQVQLNNAGFNPRVRFSPDGKRLLSICHDSHVGLAQWSSDEVGPENHLREAERRSVVWLLHNAAGCSWFPGNPLFLRNYDRVRSVALVGVWEHLARSHLHAIAGHAGAAEADLTEALRLAGDNVNALAACGDGLAARGRWHDAGAALNRVLAAAPDVFTARCRAADVCLHLRDHKGQEAHCRELLRYCSAGVDAFRAREVVRRLLAAPRTAVEDGALLRLAEFAGRAGTQYKDDAYLEWARGIVDVRGGRYDRAVDRLARAVPRFNTDRTKAARAETLFFIAVAQHHLHHPAEARARLAEGASILGELGPAGKGREVGDYWSDWVYVRAAADEAAALIGKR